MSNTFRVLETENNQLIIQGSAASTYDALVLSDGPALYVKADTSSPSDTSGFAHTVSASGSPAASATLPNGDAALVFNGTSQYVEVGDANDLSVNGAITIEAWMRPDVLTFPVFEGSGYVYWMGKGTTNEYEYACRMYNFTNSENRPNRISGYAFNLSGGLGVGSYFQDAVIAGAWIHYALVINTASSGQYPQGYTKIYKNGALRDQDDLSALNIVPQNGTEPFRIATRDFNSYFEGAIGKIAIYDYELTAAQLYKHYSTMVPPIVGTAKLIGQLASNQTSASGTTLTLTVTRDVQTGRFLVARVGQTYTAATPTMADSRGNTWTSDRSAPDGGHTMRATIFSCPVTTQLLQGDTITVTFSSTTTKVAVVDEFIQVASPKVIDGQNGASGTSTTPGVNLHVQTAHANDLLVGLVVASGDTSVAYTEDVAYQSLGRGGVAGGALTVNGAYQSVGITSNYQYRPTIDTSETWIEALIAYEGF